MINKIKEVIKCLIVILVYILFLKVTRIGCPIRFLTGISCMGCGMTRAFIALVNMDFEKALYYHPLIFLTPVIIIFICVEDELTLLNKKIVKYMWISIISLFCITYLIRLIAGKDSVVQINIRDGFIYKMIRHLGEEGSLW